MSTPMPRTTIPASWAAQGHCPVCRAGPLTIRPTPNAPDQLLCPQCATAFEVEQDGPRLRLTHWPAPLTPFLPSAAWRTRAEIKEAMQAALHPQAETVDEGRKTEGPPQTIEGEQKAEEPPIEETLDTKAFLEPARKLYALGNSPAAIRAALKNAGAEPEQIEMALLDIYDRDRARRKQQRLRLQWASGAAALSIILLFAVFVALGGLNRRPAATAPTPMPETATEFARRYGTPTRTPLPYNPVVELLNQALPTGVRIANGPSPTPRPTRTPRPTATVGPGTPLPPTDPPPPTLSGGLPGWVLTVAPPGISVMEVPTPSVEYGVGPAASVCPKTPASAASLFGGKAEHWSYAADTSGWVLIVADDPITLAVPAGMRAGYLVIGQTLAMTSVSGPATIHNINFAAITCE